jgi:hypothetical protein
MELEQTAALMAAGAIVAFIQHGQTILQSIGWKIPGSVKVLTAFALSLGAAAVVLLVGEENGAILRTDNVEDWLIAFGVVLGGSQTIFAIVLPTLGSVTKD